MLFFADSVLAQKSVVQTIVLDAGHEVKIWSSWNWKICQNRKHIALDVTLKLGEYLKAAFPEMKIVYTRTKDTFPTLKDRTDLANNSMPIYLFLFIAILLQSHQPKEVLLT